MQRSVVIATTVWRTVEETRQMRESERTRRDWKPTARSLTSFRDFPWCSHRCTLCTCVHASITCPPPVGRWSKREGGERESNPLATSCVHDCNFTPTQLSRPSRWSIDRSPDIAVPLPLPCPLPVVVIPVFLSLFCRLVCFVFFPLYRSPTMHTPAPHAQCVNRELVYQCCAEWRFVLPGVRPCWQQVRGSEDRGLRRIYDFSPIG